MSLLKIYCAGAYTAPEDAGILANVIHALRGAVLVAEAGAHPIVPHTALPFCDTWQDAMNACRDLFTACDGVFMMPGWEHSRGARMEHDWAHEQQMPVFYAVEALRQAVLDEEAA